MAIVWIHTQQQQIAHITLLICGTQICNKIVQSQYKYTNYVLFRICFCVVCGSTFGGLGMRVHFFLFLVTYPISRVRLLLCKQYLIWTVEYTQTQHKQTANSKTKSKYQIVWHKFGEDSQSASFHSFEYLMCYTTNNVGDVGKEQLPHLPPYVKGTTKSYQILLHLFMPFLRARIVRTELYARTTTLCSLYALNSYKNIDAQSRLSVK